jgi:hypothetical protein
MLAKYLSKHKILRAASMERFGDEMSFAFDDDHNA